MTELIELGKVAGAVVAIVGLVVLIGKAVRSMIRTVRRLGRLADEVLGDGDERPGWGKRLTAMETLGKTNAGRLTAIEKNVGMVVAEVKPNGGSSLKDQVTRIEQTMNTPGENS